jgi:biopolymer transport protein ExbD
VSGTPGSIVQINVTPLIDVMLVLLILFMVVTPMTTRGLDAALPQKASVAPSSPPPALVLVVEQDRLSLNQQPLASLEDLEARLRNAFDARSDRTLFLKASGVVSYRRVIEALDVARGAGAERVGLLPDSSEH